MQQHTAWAEIDLSALTYNLQCVRQCAPTSRIVTMIKADAYGHGLLQAARTLADQSDKLGVARLSEARTLRDDGITTPLLLMGTLLDAEDFHYCAAQKIAVALHDLSQVDVIEQANLQQALEIWLKLDTGMNRLGLTPENLLLAQRRLSALPLHHPLKLMTHFSSADATGESITETQIAHFRHLQQQLPDLECSLANSAGIIAWPQSHAQWVRPGIMLYGDNPVAQSTLTLKPVMHLKSRVLAIKEVLAGESVGYNQIWTAPRTSRIAAIGIGYGDGYPRQLGNGTPLAINGERLPLVGRISMDICSVDITNARIQPAVGDEVTLWGDTVSAAEIAERAGTISYHLFTGITRRVPRIYC